MKKSVIILSLVLIAGCSAKVNQPDPTVPPEMDASVPTATPAMTSNEESRPYPESQWNAVDFSLFFDTIPAESCSGDLSKEMCIELYGEKSALPEDLTLIDVGENGEYHSFTLENSDDHSSIHFAVLHHLYDSLLVRADFILDENNHSEVMLYFYYDQDIQQHPEYYDIGKSIENWGGTNIYHTAYAITQKDIVIENNEVVDHQGDYSLVRMQNFYCDSTDSEDSKTGCNYIQNLEIVKFTE
ncbi:hypothetical protein [Holdemania massiliensis]|uniref:hypothetical protein n=1 Tax=Holdemania massiliensis TaxID=1468449 RepID=UPI001F056A5B|nr:hypothetical protein [Holdemania massiliensis]MCH1939363.1 hypothetical protein [Holdemania massiliensis]